MLERNALAITNTHIVQDFTEALVCSKPLTTQRHKISVVKKKPNPNKNTYSSICIDVLCNSCDFLREERRRMEESCPCSIQRTSRPPQNHELLGWTFGLLRAAFLPWRRWWSQVHSITLASLFLKGDFSASFVQFVSRWFWSLASLLVLLI